MGTSPFCIRAKFLLIAVFAVVLPLKSVAAQSCEVHSISNTNTRNWQAPLSRSVTVIARVVSMRDAIDAIARTAGVRISYSAEMLPLGRSVCVQYKAVTLGDALLDLLKGVRVQPMVAANDQVALAPGSPDSMPTVRSIVPLKPVVAEASPAEVQKQQPSFSVATITSRQITEQGSIAQALNATVPGVWSWQSPLGFTNQYSVRGASSFGVTSPKVYIDGIEVANPLLVTQIQPDNVEKIEFVRGPQGAAIYGADAINGVTNIVTRHGPVDAVSPHLRIRSGVAVSQTDFMANPSLGQDHTLSLQLGSSTRSAMLNGGYGRSGEYVPGAYTNHYNFDGSGRIVGSRAILTGTGRFISQSSLNPGGVRLDSVFKGVTPLNMQQYTLGLRTVVRQNDHITHAFVLGADGYQLSGVPSDSMSTKSVTDSILRAAGDDGLRTTLRASSMARFEFPHQLATSLTVSAEHSGLHQSGSAADVTSYGEWMSNSRPRVDYDSLDHRRPDQELPEYLDSATFSQSRSARSLSAQLDASWRDKLFLNGGLRFENDVVNSVNTGTSLMPMVGGAFVTGNDRLSVKLRAAYGKGVRWPEMGRAGAWNTHSRVGGLSLSPEKQSGIEAGVDVAVGGALAVQVTRYDQTASGLVQSVAVLPPTNSGPGGSQGGPGSSQQPQRPTYSLQNVGDIANKGWEMQATVRRGALSLGGTLSLTDSRVSRLANGYKGDLVAGDRMLGVPARTMTLDASWLATNWSASAAVARAFDWINYDRVGLIAQPNPVTGLGLRNFWQRYNGFTHVRATVTRTLTHGLTLQFIGDNLLGKQLGEPDNLTVVPGRTVSIGVKAAF